MGVLRRILQPELNRRQRLSGTRWVGLGTHPRLYKGLLGLLIGCVRNVQERPVRWPKTPGGIGLVRRADLSIKPRSGCGVLFGRGQA